MIKTKVGILEEKLEKSRLSEKTFETRAKALAA